jgi:hypothetical protein
MPTQSVRRSEFPPFVARILPQPCSKLYLSITAVSYFGNLFTDEPLPKDGYVELTRKPGFGVTLNR